MAKLGRSWTQKSWNSSWWLRASALQKIKDPNSSGTDAVGAAERISRGKEHAWGHRREY